MTEQPGPVFPAADDPLFNGEGWPDDEGIRWHYQSIEEYRAALLADAEITKILDVLKAPLQPGAQPVAPELPGPAGGPQEPRETPPCATCGAPSEYGVAGIRYCEACAP